MAAGFLVDSPKKSLKIYCCSELIKIRCCYWHKNNDTWLYLIVESVDRLHPHTHVCDCVMFLLLLLLLPPLLLLLVVLFLLGIPSRHILFIGKPTTTINIVIFNNMFTATLGQNQQWHLSDNAWNSTRTCAHLIYPHTHTEKCEGGENVRNTPHSWEHELLLPVFLQNLAKIYICLVDELVKICILAY